MNIRYTIGGAALAVMLGAGIGCSHEGGGAAEPTAYSTGGEPVAQTLVPAAPSAEAKHHPDAATALLRATDQQSLNDTEKATVRSLKQQLQESRQSLDAAFRAMRADLAAQVRAGAIDPARVHADEELAANALEAHQKLEFFVLNGLHALLNPGKRVAAATTVRSGAPGRAEAQAQPEPAEGTAARLDRMTRELRLDTDQQQQVASLLAAQPGPMPARHDAYRERFDALLNAFPTETFDAKAAVQTMPSPTAALREHVERKVGFLSALLPILRPDQRQTLASMIEQRGAERAR
jgi:hypothetical protein